MAPSRALALTAALLALAAAQRPASAPIVAIDCGPVSGAVDPVRFRDATFVYRYSSIPYAAPPLGNLRWRAPAPPLCWAGVLNGSAVPDECPQTSGRGNEDCLYLHVVRPTSPPPPAGWPVLVYFHGGNLIGGGTPGMIAPNAVTATQTPGGAVVVSAAYRLGVLGWSAFDGFDAESSFAGNYGALDAIAALEWVQRNIAAFGGDRRSVALYGQSSGGTLIFALYAAPKANGLFVGALSLSGSPNITQDHATKLAQDAPIAAGLGCGPPMSPQQRAACLRALPAFNVSRASPPGYGTPGIFGWPSSGIPAPGAGGMAYYGIVHVDGFVLTTSFDDALVANTVDAALILSNMEAECDGGPGIVVRNSTPAQWATTVASAFSTWPGGGADEAASVLAAYAEEAAVDPQLAYDAISADYGLTCAGREIAQKLARSGTTRTRPVYLLYNAFVRSQYPDTGAERWPNHGLDLTELGWAWPYVNPIERDFAEAAVMLQVLGDLASHKGVLPASWSWPPVAGTGAPPGGAIYTMVLANNGTSIYPGNGVRAERDWRAGRCDALKELAGRTYWWCD